MFKRRWSAVFLVVCIGSGLVWAQDAGKPSGPATNAQAANVKTESAMEARLPEDFLKGLDEQNSMRLTLQQCMLMMMISNYDIQIKQIDPRTAAQEILAAKAVFDPVVQMNLAKSDQTAPSVDQLEVGFDATGVSKAKENVNSIDMSISKKIQTGGTVTIQYSFDSDDKPTDPFLGFNPAYNTKTSFVLSHPLLRNVGIWVNNADIYIALSQKRISDQELRLQILQRVYLTGQAYWKLVNARADYLAGQASLKRAEDFRSLVAERIKAGALAESDIYDAEAEVAIQRDGVDGFRMAVLNAEEDLKQLMNLKDGEPLSRARILPTDRPAFQPEDVSIPDSEKRALKIRPEVHIANEQKEQARIRRRYAKNQKLPELNLEVSYGVLGLGRDYADSMKNMAKKNFTDKRISLAFTYPLFNREAIARLEQANLGKQQANLTAFSQRQQIALDVRTSARRRMRAANRVLATRAIYKARLEALEAMKDRFNNGKVTPFDVVQSLERLAIAEKDVESALGDYRISLNEYHLAVGDILDFHHLQMANAPPEAQKVAPPKPASK